MITLILIIFFIAINLTVMVMSSRQSLPVSGVERLTISIVAPIQSQMTSVINLILNVWRTYFMAVVAVEENHQLKKQLSQVRQIQNRLQELELENQRLKKFVNFTGSVHGSYVAAQVIARDPSPWFKTIMIDKGLDNGLEKGDPVMVSEGIVGHVVEASDGYSKVLLITDRNSAVDGLVQTTRVRGIVKGDNTSNCYFVYALKKDDIKVGQVIISSGLDKVFPKGLMIGRVLKIEEEHSQLFQKIFIETTVDFDKLEEVLVFKDAG